MARDASGNFAAGIITAALTGNASTATTLANSRSIYGNTFNGSADLNQIIASTYGGTGNGFTKFVGPTSSEKTFTLPDSNATLARTDAAQTFIGNQTFAYSSSTSYSSFITASTTNLIVGNQSFNNLAGTGLTNNSGSLGLTNTSVTVNTGTGLSGGGTVALGGTITLSNQLATSSGEVMSNLAYWTTTNGVPAKLGSVATTSLSATGALSLDHAISVIGSAAATLTCLTATVRKPAVSPPPTTILSAGSKPPSPSPGPSLSPAPQSALADCPPPPPLSSATFHTSPVLTPSAMWPLPQQTLQTLWWLAIQAATSLPAPSRPP